MHTLLRMTLGAALAAALLGSTASAAQKTGGQPSATVASAVTAVRMAPSGPVGHMPGSGSRVLSAPKTVTVADNGDTVLLSLRDAFQLQLGGSGMLWHVSVSPSGILAGPSGVELSGAATYQAEGVGTATLRAVGGPACLRASPPCLPPELLFQLTVIVQGGGSATGTGGSTPGGGSRAIVEGTVLAVHASTVELRLPTIYPVCKLGQPCPMFLAMGRRVQVDLGGATFDNTQGMSVATPLLQVGDQLMAAGRWQAGATDALQAQVAAVLHQAGTVG